MQPGSTDSSGYTAAVAIQASQSLSIVAHPAWHVGLLKYWVWAFGNSSAAQGFYVAVQATWICEEAPSGCSNARIAEGEDGKEEEIAAPEKKDTKKETKSESKKGKGNKPKSAKEPSKGGQKIEQKGQKAPDIEKEGSLDQDMVESKAQEDEQHKAHTIQDSSWCSSWWVLKCFNDMQIP